MSHRPARPRPDPAARPAWNAALAGTQQTQGVPAGTPGRIAIPVAADSDEARRVAMRLVDDTCFAPFDPFDAGVLADSWRRQPGTPAYCTELALKELESALAAADRAEASDRAGIGADRSTGLMAPTVATLLEAAGMR
ncbi:hypothetical protein [Streptomyces sp. NPDC058335]|uniref:hypothetical protein n=1 Tax=Streptomyces sp. NPDC058335 TaxID=3346451 RepID=UPI0036661F0A